MPKFGEDLLGWLTTGGVKIAIAFLIKELAARVYSYAGNSVRLWVICWFGFWNNSKK